MTKPDEGADERLLGPLSEALPAPQPRAGLRRTLSDQLRGPQRYAPFEAEVVEAFDVAHSAVQEVFARAHDDSAWRCGPWPESHILSTQALAAHGVVLARLAPGTRIEPHGHSARELTYVLSGRLAEDSGRTLRAGELLTAEAGYEHALHVEGTEPCLVVFAVRSPE